MTKGGMRTKDERGAEAEPDEHPRSVKMRNDEGTARMTPRRRVGGYCSAETGDFAGEISRGEHSSRLDSHERDREIVSQERKLEDPD